MTDKEKRSTDLLHSTDELRRLIIENPDLPLLVFAGGEANIDDEYFFYTFCSEITAEKGEFLDCWQEINEERFFISRQEFKEEVEEWLEDSDSNLGLSKRKMDALVEKELTKYEPYWKPCIILCVDN